MGWISDAWDNVTDFVEDTVKYGGEIVAAPVRFAGETIRGENPFDNVLDLGKKGVGLTARAITAEPLINIQATRDLMKNETVDRLTGGLGDKMMTTYNVTGKLSDGREVQQYEWEAARQFGTATGAMVLGGYVAGEGAALYNEAQGAASVGGWSFGVPSIGLSEAATGAMLYSAVAKGNYQGAAQALGIPAPLAGFLPGGNQSRPPASGGSAQPTGPFIGSGPTVTSSYAPMASSSSTKTMLMVAGVGLAIGAAYLIAKRK